MTNNEEKAYKILVVDDEPDLRELLADEFEYAGHTPFMASNGKEAYDLCNNEEFDAVISDVRMPGGDGIELLERLTSKDGAPLVFLVTGYADITKDKALEKGATNLLTKPYDIIELCEAVLSTLNSR
jgi:DNA-binding response OmpR family regulator